MPNNDFDVGMYVTWKRKDVGYADMSRYNLSSEQVREIAIARANARKKADEEVVTVQENTRWQLEVVKLDAKKPSRIIIDDSDTKILAYNHEQMMSFKKSSTSVFADGQIIHPSWVEWMKIRDAFKKFYDSDIYSRESVENCKKLQELLGFTWEDIDGAFWPMTQNKLEAAFIKKYPAQAPKPIEVRDSTVQWQIYTVKSDTGYFTWDTTKMQNSPQSLLKWNEVRLTGEVIEIEGVRYYKFTTYTWVDAVGFIKMDNLEKKAIPKDKPTFQTISLLGTKEERLAELAGKIYLTKDVTFYYSKIWESLVTWNKISEWEKLNLTGDFIQIWSERYAKFIYIQKWWPSVAGYIKMSDIKEELPVNPANRTSRRITWNDATEMS